MIINHLKPSLLTILNKLSLQNLTHMKNGKPGGNTNSFAIVIYELQI